MNLLEPSKTMSIYFAVDVHHLSYLHLTQDVEVLLSVNAYADVNLIVKNLQYSN